MTELRPVWAEVDLVALRANVAELRRIVSPARVLAVVKADGYGHGAVATGRAAVDAGATKLGIALVEEGVELREAGIDAPILVLSEPTAAAATTVVAARLTPAVYTAAGIEALAKAVVEHDAGPLPVHLKVDTGMHRVGAAPEEADALAALIAAHRELRFEGLWTHLAVADEPDNPYTVEQLERFDAVRARLAHGGHRPDVVHAANTAGALAFPAARYDIVRPGIGIYGIPPVAELASVATLKPVLSVKARVSFVKRLPAGAAISYGLRYRVERRVNIATVPIGYGDGVPRNLAEAGGEVLVRGRRRPIAGTVTMDQLMVDMGDDDVEVGEEVVLIGSQGAEEVAAAEWAARLQTIPYEIVCNIGPRVPRRALS
ncbi:MAG: alanine racemase [Actinomycetota bacterium]|nr:alanine racemase [Actinomycetota bacterium]